jgi:hypothetical protein
MKALALALLTACSPYSISGPTTPSIAAFGGARTDVGTICIIRSSPWARAVTFVVHDNQTLVGATKGDSYFCYEAEPGQHVIVSDTFDSTDKPGRTHAMIHPGGRYWLRQDHSNNFGSVTSKLEWVDGVTAGALIAGCSYRVVTTVPGHEQVPPPVPFAPAARDPFAVR